jgi:voltage-gated potassium channel Kch
MQLILTVASIALIILVLVDSFETTVLPRRVTRRYRFVRMFYVTTWKIWRGLALRIAPGKWRETFLSLFGPLSLLALLASWVIALIFGFGLLHWSLATADRSAETAIPFATYLYWSGETFFTLGYGDITPVSAIGRLVCVAESGTGFGFLALIISYAPVIFQTYSHREVMIALLDARAGSPPSAAALLVRAGRAGSLAAIDPFLAEWERWSAELLESHLSFPMLSFYRSQHDNQSWLAALTSVLDTCAVAIAIVKDRNPFQSQLTFAMSRHAAVDLALVLKTPPKAADDRLPAERLERLREVLTSAGFALHEPTLAREKFAELRAMYEPFVYALADRLLFALPAILPDEVTADNWQRSAWLKRAPQLGELPVVATGDGHFE